MVDNGLEGGEWKLGIHGSVLSLSRRMMAPGLGWRGTGDGRTLVWRENVGGHWH